MDDQERRLAASARGQLGVFSLAQALEVGYERPVVRRRLASGAWMELEPRIYRGAISDIVDWRARLLARTLATGGVAAFSSAAALYGLVGATAVRRSSPCPGRPRR
ncbi:MAG: hypothetical protein ABW211_03205, partial [Acidimicrobiia bacterium]